MNLVSRGVRNAFRNVIRTLSITLILGLSIGLALAMLVARAAVKDKVQSVKSSIGNTITVSPAGSSGFEGGGEPLTNTQVKTISDVSNVTDVTATLSDRLTSSSTNLQSAIEPGSLGNRRAGNSGVGFEAPPSGASGPQNNSNRPSVTRTFTPPVMITGTNNVSQASIFNGSSVSYTSGQAIDPSKDTNEAIVGKALAAKNNLNVGSTFQAYNTDIKVVGIYDAGNEFSNSGVVMSLISLQRLSSQPNDVTSATVTVNSIDNVNQAVADIKAKLSTAADVVSNQDNANQAIAPLENVMTIATFSLVGALVAGAVIILLTMVMIVRERRREIGVYKAIGASNVKIVFQFMTEAITLTLLGLVAGLIIGTIAANPITNTLVTNSTQSTSGSQQAVPGTRGPGQRFRSFGNNTLTNTRNIKTSVGLNIVAYGAGAAIIIAVVGSTIPALFISKIRPAEVMRAE